MKKFVVFILALVMTASLCACGGGSSAPATTAAPDTTAAPAETTKAAESEGTEAAPEETTEAETEAEAKVQMETLEASASIDVSAHPWFRGDFVIYKSTENTDAKTDKDTFVYGNSSAVKNADPNTFQNEFNWCEQVYDVLIRKDLNGGDEFLPGLATEWGYNSDGSFEMTLREGVKFHDGTTLDADDVLFTFQRIASNSVNKSSFAMSCVDFDKSEAIDDLHVKIVFNEPVGSWLNELASGYCSIMSKEYCEANPEATFLDSDAGSGPYKLVETVTGISQTMEAFADYWEGAPEIKTVIYKLYKDYSVMAIDFKNGDLDAAFNVTYDIVQEFLGGGMPGATLYQVPSRSVFMNMSSRGDTPLSDVRLRQALAHCVDYTAVAAAVYQSNALGKTPTGPFPNACKYSKDLGIIEYNPELSMELLKECGYSTDNPCKLSFLTTNSPAASKCATILQQFGALVGFEIDITEVDSSSSNAVVNSPELPPQYDLCIFTKSYDTGSPESFLADREMYSDPENTSAMQGIEDAKFNELAEKAAKTTDETEREKLYSEIQDMFYENFWTVQYVTANAMVLTQPYVNEINFLSGYHPQYSSITYNR